MQSLLAIPEESARGQLRFSSAFFVCGSHGVLANHPVVQNNLLYLLLFRGEQPGSLTAGAAVGR
jgi:hypothetical protein